MTPPHDAHLVAARTGDRDAFGRLVETRWHALVRFSRSIVGDMDAEDVAQDACVACWRKVSQLADLRSFDAWLMRSLFRLAVRRARWQRVRGLLLARDEPGVGHASRLAGRSDDAIFVWQLLSRLPPRQRAVLHLTAVEGMTDAEVGQALGIRAGSVRAHRRRARETLEAWLPRTTRRANPAEAGSHVTGAGLEVGESAGLQSSESPDMQPAEPPLKCGFGRESCESSAKQQAERPLRRGIRLRPELSKRVGP